MPVDTGDAAVELVTAMRALPRELRPRVRPALTRAGQAVLADARERSSWSTRIPRSLQLRVQFAGDRPGVRISARRGMAPHARPFEGLQRRAQAGYFRHPVFETPLRRVWVQQATRPFLMPAVDANRDRVIAELGDALTSSLAAAGWRPR